MTDVPDGSGQIPRRAPRVSDGGAPVSGGLAIVLAVVAVVAGFLILRSISDGGESGAFPTEAGGNGSETGSDGSDTSESGVGTETTVGTLVTTTIEPELVVTGAKVLVANANGVGGSAGAMTRALSTGPGFETVDPVNASSTIGDIDQSAIYYTTTNPAAEAVAQSLATVLGGVSTVAPMPETPPTADGELGGADVLLMLGNDKAGKTLAELAPAADQGATVVTNPSVAGETTTTTVAG